MPYRTPSPPPPVRSERCPYADPLGRPLRALVGLTVVTVAVYVWAAGVLLAARFLAVLSAVLTP